LIELDLRRFLTRAVYLSHVDPLLLRSRAHVCARLQTSKLADK